MEATTRTRVNELVDSLIAEGEDLKRTEWTPPDEMERAGFRVIHSGGRPVYVDHEKFQRWTARCRQLPFLFGDAVEPWKEVLTHHHANTLGDVHQILGAILAIQEALRNGLLLRVEDLVMADAFDSLLEQAEYLLTEGYVVAGGVLGRAVLEEHLRKWCERSKCPPERDRASLDDFKASLYKAKTIDKLTMKHVEAMAAVGNDAAHVNPGLKNDDVVRFLRDVREFLVRYPASAT